MRIKTILLAAFLFCVSTVLALAQHPTRAQIHERSKVDTKWEAKADANHDGRVDKVEAHQWKRHHNKVNTSVEKKYDANANGYLEPQEAREMLKDKYTVIKTHGNAKVDSALEQEYDKNHDGVIDAKEAEDLQKALQ